MAYYFIDKSNFCYRYHVFMVNLTLQYGEANREYPLSTREKVMSRIFVLQQDRPSLNKLLSKVPVLPTVVSKMLVLDKQSDDYYEDVLSLASEDPFIAAKIISLANSAALAGRNKIETLTQAVVRVGVNEVSTLITSISLSKSFKPTEQSHRDLWLHTLQVALICTKIAQLNQVNSEQAYLSGLLHKIGRFILMTADTKKFATLPTETQITCTELVEQEMAVFGYNSIDVTINTLHVWNIPEAIAHAITLHLLDTVGDHFDTTEVINTVPELQSPDHNIKVLSEVLSVAAALSNIILQHPAIESMDENTIGTLVKSALSKLKKTTLFLPTAALAKMLPTVTQSSTELAVSLGVN